MKKYLIINMLVGAALLLQLFPASGQTPWSELELSNGRAKITPSHKLKYSFSLDIALPLQHELSQKMNMQDIQNAAFEPATRERLFENLGGPFIIGPFSDPSVSLTGRTQPLAGIQLGIGLLEHFAIQAGVCTYRSEWSGEFPVQVVRQDQTAPESRHGSVAASASGVMLNMEIVCFLPGRVLQPFAKAGANWQASARTKSTVVIEEAEIPVKTGPAGASFSFRAGAGIRANACKHVFIDTACVFGKMPGGRYPGMAELALGWRF